MISFAALAATVGVFVQRGALGRTPGAAALAVDEDVRDAVAEPAPSAALIALGKPVPVSWFRTPAGRHAEIERVLLSSRRRRALARSVSVQ